MYIWICEKVKEGRDRPGKPVTKGVKSAEEKQSTETCQSCSWSQRRQTEHESQAPRHILMKSLPFSIAHSVDQQPSKSVTSRRKAEWIDQACVHVCVSHCVFTCVYTWGIQKKTSDIFPLEPPILPTHNTHRCVVYVFVIWVCAPVHASVCVRTYDCGGQRSV